MTSFAANPALRRHWYAVARSSDLLDRPQGVRLLGEDLVIWRGAGGVVAAAPDRCPHREAPLSAGSCKDGNVVCPYHGWTFDGTGRCVLVPSAGQGAPVPPKAHLATVHATERYGLVWLCLGEPAAGIPEIPQDVDPAFRRITQPVEQWQAATTRLVDNFLDYSHFPYVHLGSFGGATDAEVPKVELEQLGDFYGYRYDVVASNEVSVASGASGQSTSVVSRTMTTGFSLPFLVRSTIAYQSGLEHILLLVSTPRDDETTYFTFVVWRNDDFSVPADEVTRLDRLIGSEDKRMLEQVKGTLPLDATTLVNVQADKASVEWKRQLRELLATG